MGGAIAVHTASANYIPSLIGLAVIDVVEGTALDALASMQSFLRGRPTHFKSLEHAIEWWQVMFFFLKRKIYFIMNNKLYLVGTNIPRQEPCLVPGST